MGCVVYFFMIPFYLLYYIFYFSFIIFILIIWMFKVFIMGILWILSFIIKPIGNSKFYQEYRNNYYKVPGKMVKMKSNKKKESRDLEFDKESSLWGLSSSDKRIAKEERMSPADFIEAEERDDDNLDTDDF